MRKLVVSLALFFALAVPAMSFAAFNAQDSGLQQTGKQAYGEAATSTDQASLGIFIGQKIIQPVLGLTGLLFLVLMVYAGILWMTAAGNEKQVKKAKDIIGAAVVGAVLMASAYVLTNAVFNALDSGSTTGSVGGLQQ